MANKFNTLISEQRKAEYKATYDRLMARAHGRSYVKGIHENHHIVPKSLGGSNEKSNIVPLTYREHFLAHWLLTKFTEGEARRKMLYALYTVSGKTKNHSKRIVSGWQYEISRLAISEAKRGQKSPRKGQKLNLDENQRNSRRNRMIGNDYGSRTKGKKMGKNNKRSKPVRCIDDGKIFSARNEAARFYNICAVNIGEVCLGTRISAKGLKFEYIT